MKKIKGRHKGGEEGGRADREEQGKVRRKREGKERRRRERIVKGMEKGRKRREHRKIK